MTGRRGIPTSDELVREAAREMGINTLPAADIRSSFNQFLSDIGDRTLAIYERYEHDANARNLPRRVLDNNPRQVEEAEKVSKAKGFQQGVLHLLGDLYPELRQAFPSVSQSRKSRGGKSFEDQFALLLKMAGFHYERQHRQFRTDFILPSNSAFDRNRTVCAVASLKRTLRERWQEVAGELTQLRAPNVFLVTADDKVSPGHVKGVCDDNLLHLVVWDSVKQRYANHPRVLGFTHFANQRLPQLQSQWENAE